MRHKLEGPQGLADLFTILEGLNPNKMVTDITLPKKAYSAINGKGCLYGGGLWGAHITMSDENIVIVSNGDFQIRMAWGGEYDHESLVSSVSSVDGGMA